MKPWNKDYIDGKKSDLPRIVIWIDRIKAGLDGYKWHTMNNHITTIKMNPYLSDDDVYNENHKIFKRIKENLDSDNGYPYYHITHCFSIPRENDLISILDFYLLVNKVIYNYSGDENYGGHCTIIIYTKEISVEEYKKLIGKV